MDMTTRKLLQESGTLAKGASGTYRVCLITEGRGSSGLYPRETFTAEEAQKFAGSLSFMNHPLDPNKPYLRPATDIVGRVGESVVVEEHDGLLGFWADYTPSASKPQSTAFLAEYADALGLSIYIGAAGHEEEDGTFVIESFDGDDPYRSVDVVVAAGRGGRFERANEAYHSIETSARAVSKPSVASAVETQQKEGHMDEVLQELRALRTDFNTFITESKAAESARAVAEANADAIEKDKVKAATDAVESYDEKIAAIDAVEGLLPSQVAALRKDAKEGRDIAESLASATALLAEFKTLAESDVAAGGRILSESGNDDFTIPGWGK